eukprot:scaffold24102_cov153-Isochrysis_galbana.AAC.1
MIVPWGAVGVCRREPCREARLRCGRGEVRGVWRRSGRERLAPGLLCRRSVGGSVIKRYYPRNHITIRRS